MGKAFPQEKHLTGKVAIFDISFFVEEIVSYFSL